MKITVYTTTDCQFSKAEKEYLNSHTLQFEEKNLETNKEFLTEMLAVSNNFAGTPVTRVEKDDGTIAVLKGFTKEEFDTTFGFTAEPAKTEPAPAAEEMKPTEESVKPVETIPAVPTPPVSQTPLADEKLNSVLDKLEEKTAPESTPPVETPLAPTEVVPPTMPTETPPANPPSIPDFPAADAKTTA